MYECEYCMRTFDRKSRYLKHRERKTPCIKNKTLPSAVAVASKSLPEPSNEQMDIINAVSDEYNVIVSAVAGSGKTTAINLIAKHLYPKEILVITYNRRLMDDGNIRAKEYSIDNMEVRTYHSLCSKLHQKAEKDAGIIAAIKSDSCSKRDINYDIIIIDEAQDCKNLLYKYVVKVLGENKKNVQLVILGDGRQNIYKFDGADSRYLSCADKIMKNGKEWKTLTLSTSYRLTPAVAGFINNCMLGKDVIVGGNTRNINMKPEYHIIDGFNNNLWDKWVDDFERMLDKNSYKYDDVFIIASSVRQGGRIRNPVTRLENALVRKGIPCNAITFDDEQLNKNTMRGKIVFSTFHSVKGLERKVVVVLGMDAFFYKLGNNTNESRDVCPNPLYVACTRVLEKMILVHNASNNHLPFLKKKLLEDYVDVKKYSNYSKTRDYMYKKKDTIECTTLIKGIKEELFEPFTKYFNVIQHGEDSIVKDTIINTNGDQYENVSDIIGVGVVEYSVMPIIKDITIRRLLLRDENKIPENYLKFIKSDKNNDNKFKSIKYILELANIYLSYSHGFLFKLSQLKRYDFITQEIVNKLADRLRFNLSKKIETEISKRCSTEWYDGTHKKFLEIYSRCDVIDYDNKTLWEVKCKQSLTTTDKLQLIIYTVSLADPEYKYKLINLYTNEIIELTYNDCLKDLLNQFITDKYKYIQEISDTEFINTNRVEIRGNIDQDCFVLDEDEEDKEDEKKYTMVFDIETTGTSSNNHRIVSICWELFDKDNELQSSKYYIVRPTDFNINEYPNAVKIHKITQNKALDKGVPLTEILSEFNESLNITSTLVAHNLTFDEKFIMKESGRNNKLDVITKMANLKKYCTMKNSRTIVNAKDYKGHLKNPNLGELYKHFFNDTFNAHNADEDVKACAKCYFKLIN